MPTRVLFGLLMSFPFFLAAQTTDQQPLTLREKQLLDRVEKLEQRLAVLEANANRTTVQPAPPQPMAPQQPETVATAGSPTQPEKSLAATKTNESDRSAMDRILGGTTINGNLDTYYSYNFNNPIGRVNLLRAYDVTSNAFSLNQLGLIVENAPDIEKGKRWGARFDLQFGPATQSTQGNPANELRPEVYRNIFQAYGTYIFPVGKGLKIDFGKWAGTLGVEGNYTKDQMNYSRGFVFQFLPFYHMGLRANYQVNDKLALNFWLVNGTQQTEPFNAFKDQNYGFNLQPIKSLNWTFNYYFGQENPDIYFNPANPSPGLPTLQGTPFRPIPNAPKGKLHIFNTYATWNATPKWTFAGETDYVIQRLETTSAPARANTGALYAQYALTPKLALAGRGEYLADKGGLYSGADQILRETTFTLRYTVANGLLAFTEWRRDWSNQPYFLTDTLGTLKKEQNFATLGLVWWFGQKQGAW